jgi:2-C-methyl-D-erythritol 4-phosphate cytidylyltransferase/2-C-methyl-D-erythritol 2,4-cyclodiphosphate synthase
MHVTAIIAAGGAGRRLAAAVPKQLLDIDGRSILQRSVEAFLTHPRIAEVIVALPPAILRTPPAWLSRAKLVPSGERRQDSVASAFDAVAENAEVVLVHDAARPFVSQELISRAIDAAAAHGAAIAAMPVSDTVKRVGGGGEPDVILHTIRREEIFLAQTPQAFRRNVLRDAVALGRSGIETTDEAMLAERAGYRVRIVPGDPANLKITTAADLSEARRRAVATAGASSASNTVSGRIGIGYDLHRLVDGRPLVLAGVTIPSDRGPQGHSDADVVCHSVTDAILGAARAGDIGQHFPDTDPRWRGASSIALLRDAVAVVRRRGLEIENVDVVVVLERPKLTSHTADLESALADALGIDVEHVSIKAKTNEGVDAVGRGEAIAAHAVALLRTV